MGKGIGKTDLHVPSCVSAPALWLPGVDTLLFSPSLRREAGHPGRSGDRAAGVPAKRLVSAATCVAVDLRVWPLASPGRPRPFSRVPHALGVPRG